MNKHQTMFTKILEEILRDWNSPVVPRGIVNIKISDLEKAYNMGESPYTFELFVKKNYPSFYRVQDDY